MKGIRLVPSDSQWVLMGKVPVDAVVDALVGALDGAVIAVSFFFGYSAPALQAATVAVMPARPAMSPCITSPASTAFRPSGVPVMMRSRLAAQLGVFQNQPIRASCCRRRCGRNRLCGSAGTQGRYFLCSCGSLL